MRLWHKDLISVLPRQQLLGQWRECCAIAKNIVDKGIPNHVLVNKIMNYPLDHFYTYCYLITDEMRLRGYKCNHKKLCDNLYSFRPNEAFELILTRPIFENWHNDRYMAQCFYNLQEKFDCGAITIDDWGKIDSLWVKKLNTFKIDI